MSPQLSKRFKNTDGFALVKSTQILTVAVHRKSTRSIRSYTKRRTKQRRVLNRKRRCEVQHNLQTNKTFKTASKGESKMTTCPVCVHAKRPEIDQALLRREPFRQISAKLGFEIFPDQLRWHKQRHIPEIVAVLAQAEKIGYYLLRDVPKDVFAVLKDGVHHLSLGNEPVRLELSGARGKLRHVCFDLVGTSWEIRLEATERLAKEWHAHMRSHG